MINQNDPIKEEPNSTTNVILPQPLNENETVDNGLNLTKIIVKTEIEKTYVVHGVEAHNDPTQDLSHKTAASNNETTSNTSINSKEGSTHFMTAEMEVAANEEVMDVAECVQSIEIFETDMQTGLDDEEK